MRRFNQDKRKLSVGLIPRTNPMYTSAQSTPLFMVVVFARQSSLVVLIYLLIHSPPSSNFGAPIGLPIGYATIKHISMKGTRGPGTQ